MAAAPDTARPADARAEPAGAHPWLATVPVLDDFARAAESGLYAPLPDDWVIGVADVVDSTGAIAAGRYKAVNLAGAGSIGAVANALGGRLAVFVFGGDGAGFAVPPEDAPAAADALARAAMWVRRDLGLALRAGTVTVAEARAAGHDTRVAFWRASEHVHYAMFAGGGLEWAERRLKSGAIGLDPAPDDAEPDLTGLSCRWGPVRPERGRILSLIVKPAPGAPPRRFADLARRVVATLEAGARLNPVQPAGPPMHAPSFARAALHGRIVHGGRALWRRTLEHLFTLALIWVIFRLNVRVGPFDPQRYRREMAANTDFRKFSDGLMMTVDCTPHTAERVRAILEAAEAEGVARFGLHLQDEALMTCFVPSALTPDHMHFIDGAGGGYASAARQLRG